jgi:hypothetical protein
MGGDEVQVHEGYWRMSYQSPTVIECLNKDA